MTPRRTSLLVFLLLGLLTVAGAALRLHDAAGWGVTHSLWLDELHTAWCVAGDFGDIPERARLGNYSPLYFWLVWVSTRCLGLNEWGVRLPSLLAGIALIPVIYSATARLLASRLAGLTAAGIVALDGAFFGWYTQEARPYSLVQLLAVVHVWVFFELVRGVGQASRLPAITAQYGPSGEEKSFAVAYFVLRAAFVTTTVALFYLHYTTALLLCGELAWYACQWVFPRNPSLREPPRYAVRSLSLDLAIAVALCLPAVPQLWEIFGRRANWAQFVPRPDAHDLVALFPAAPWAIGIPLVTWSLARVIRDVRRRMSGHSQPGGADQPPLSLACCWYLVPLGVAALLTYGEVARVCYPRYLMASSVALPVTAAWTVAVTARKHVVLGLLTALLVLAIVPTMQPEDESAGDAASSVQTSFTGHFVEDWRGAIELVQQHRPKDRHPVFLWAGLIEAGELHALQADDEAGDQNVLSQASRSDRGVRQSDRMRRSDQEALRRYLLFPVSGPYALNDGRPLAPLTQADELSPGDIRQVREAGGGWFVFRSPETLYPGHPNPLRRLARQLIDELAAQGVNCQVTCRQAFRGVAVIHLSIP